MNLGAAPPSDIPSEKPLVLMADLPNAASTCLPITMRLTFTVRLKRCCAVQAVVAFQAVTRCQSVADRRIGKKINSKTGVIREEERRVRGEESERSGL